MTWTSDPSLISADGVLEDLYRADWGRLLSLLVSRTRRLDLAEDALSEAFARAATRWRGEGIPANPAGWLYTTAHRHILGRLRAEAIAGRKAPLLTVGASWEPPVDPPDELADDRLQLILLCCHPALPRESRSALALRLILGVSTVQIARLFLVPPPTMSARLTRAKKKIVLAGIPLDAPVADELRSRLDEVCRTIYLAFTAGYTPTEGEQLLRVELAGEAVRLATALHELAPDAPQVQAMRALLVLQHSRRDTRELDGQLVTLAEQDRSQWHRDEIRLGLDLLGDCAVTDGYAEELRLQAAIAGEHARAAAPDETDWQAIAELYADLEVHTGSPVVRLNRAVAVAEADGAAAGLQLLTGLDQLLPNSHRLAAVRAELARRGGEIDLARRSLGEAISLCANDVERAHLRARLGTIDADAAT